MTIDWSAITDRKFEELCYDLLEKSGFVNLAWIGRKGDDRGRDILAEKQLTELGKMHVEKWLVQCKKYLARPPSPSDLKNDIAWADFHHPNVFLIMLTNTLSADTFDWLTGLTDKSSYRVQVIDEKQMRNLLEEQKELKKRYFPLPNDDLIKEYLRQIKWTFSKVRLEGMGIPTEGSDTDLEKVFIDVKARLSPSWLPKKYDVWQTSDKKKLLPIVENLKESRLPITDILRNDKLQSIVLLGDPGSGKSTIGQRICLALAGEGSEFGTNRTPFLIILREYAKERRNREYGILNYLHDDMEIRLGKLPENFVEELLTETDTLVVYDGLDEIMDKELKRTVRDDIECFVHYFETHTKHVVTSRRVGYEEAPMDINRFLHLDIQPLEPDQISKFVSDWYSERERDLKTRAERIESLLHAIHENKAVGQLAENPLLLTMIALVHKAQADLPRQRSLLYAKCVEAFLVSRDRARDLVSYDELEIKTCHEYLGYWMHASRGEGYDLAQLKESLDKFFKKKKSLTSNSRLTKVNEFIETAQRRCGLIIEQNGKFDFGHRSFREYFAARYIVTANYGISELWNAIKDKVVNSYWHEVMLLLAGILKLECERGLNKLINRILKVEKPVASVLAFDIVNEGNLVDNTLLRRIADSLLKSLFDCTEDAERKDCAYSLYTLLDSPVKKYVSSETRRLFKSAQGHIKLITLQMTDAPHHWIEELLED